MATITILNGDLSTGRLHLSDGGYTEAVKNEDINWEITSGSTNVDSIVLVQVKPGTGKNVFARGPGRVHEKKWNGKIRSNVIPGDSSEYLIRWKSKQGEVRTHDPIIAIKPGRGPGNILKLILSLFTILMSMFVIQQLFSKKKR